MEDLPFESETFDIATGINSFQFADDIVGALAETRRVLRKDGTLLMLVWGRREDCELVSGTASAVFALVPPAPDARPTLPLAEPGTIEDLMRKARLKPMASGEIASALTFRDADTAVRVVLAASARSIRHAGEEAVADTIRTTLPPFTRADGSVVWNNRFRWVRAVRD